VPRQLGAVAALQSAISDVRSGISPGPNPGTPDGAAVHVVNFFKPATAPHQEEHERQEARVSRTEATRLCAKQGTATEINGQDYAAKQNQDQGAQFREERRTRVLSAFIWGRPLCDV